MYKPLADSTLMNMSKREIIEHLRIAEHNHKVCEETINQQAENFKRLLIEERQQYIDKVVEQLEDLYTYYDNDYSTSKGNTLIDRNEAIEIVKAGGENV